MTEGVLIPLRELARRINGTVEGDPETVISGISSIEDAAPGTIVLAESNRLVRLASVSKAAAIIVGLKAESVGKPVVHVENPRLAFALALGLFARRERAKPGIDPSSRVGERFTCGDEVSVGFGCRLGDDVRLGQGVVLHPMVYVGDRVEIEAYSEIFPQASIMSDCIIGARVRIHSGVVIGADGFGYVFDGASHVKVPQIGNVVIGDDVEIGANTTIDRAKTGSTRIGSGTKIDNLVQIAHNVKIGRNCVIVALTGISGSVRIGDGVTFGGQAGVKDHVIIGDGAVVTARGGVIGDVAPGAKVSGFPAWKHSEEMRSQAQVRKLPALLRRIEYLEEQVKRLQGVDSDPSVKSEDDG